MRTLASALRRMAEVIEVTEVQAYEAYRRHLGACSAGCQPNRPPRCEPGVKLHDQWKRAERQQAGPVGAGRPR